MACGDRGVVVGVEGDRVRLAMQSGAEKLFRPDRLAKNLKQDSVSLYAYKQIELYAGHRIRGLTTTGRAHSTKAAWCGSKR